jgi:poly-gamma-glutamate capsule biosynthesis protein CapA/YwtB (metallophosphatase superfamily)
VAHARPDPRRRSRRIALSLVAVLAAGAALATGLRAGGSATVAGSGAPAAVEPVARPTTPAPTTSPPAAEITLAFAGDVHFAGRTAELLADPPTAFKEAARSLSAADLTMVNLETAVTSRGMPEPKTFTFRAPATAFTALAAAGIDVATMANNHAADYGSVGLRDTLDAISTSRFPVVGIGADATRAYAPYYVTVRGHRVALLAASQVRDRTLSAWSAGEGPGIASAYDPRLVAAVRAARTRAEVVVVYLHWGTEGSGCPNADQRAVAATLADAGADAVVGTHAHLLLGAGYLGRTYVAYGLGNFVWYVGQAETGVLRVEVHGRTAVSAELSPALIGSTGQPNPVTGGTATAQLKRFADLRRCTGLAATPSPT